MDLKKMGIILKGFVASTFEHNGFLVCVTLTACNLEKFTC